MCRGRLRHFRRRIRALRHRNGVLQARSRSCRIELVSELSDSGDQSAVLLVRRAELTSRRHHPLRNRTCCAVKECRGCTSKKDRRDSSDLKVGLLSSR